jgi:hypothetical protein
MYNILCLTSSVAVARWPHCCRRQCSEVAVPALVSSNLTEGGGFFPRKEPPPGHGCVCMSFRGLRYGGGRKSSDTLPTTARSAGFKSRPDGPPMDVVLCAYCVVQKGERRGEGGRGRIYGDAFLVEMKIRYQSV